MPCGDLMELTKEQRVVIARHAMSYRTALQEAKRAKALLEDLALVLGGVGASLDLTDPTNPRLVLPENED